MQSWRSSATTSARSGARPATPNTSTRRESAVSRRKKLWPARRRSPRARGSGAPPSTVNRPLSNRRRRRPWRRRRPSFPKAGASSGRRPETEAQTPHAEISLHRRLIRATLPRIESDAPPRPIPEFTMHAPPRPATVTASPSAWTGRRPASPGKGGFGQGRHGQARSTATRSGLLPVAAGPAECAWRPRRAGRRARRTRGPRRHRGGRAATSAWEPARPPSRQGFGRGPKKH